ncbi:Uncharacterised protein [Vibrio cholerae]|nr:Uncharacterised protein [Vibrio cholerae]
MYSNLPFCRYGPVFRVPSVVVLPGSSAQRLALQ